MFVFLHSAIGPQPYPIIYAVASPVRGLLGRIISEEHLQSSNESIKKNKKAKKIKREETTKQKTGHKSKSQKKQRQVVGCRDAQVTQKH